MIKTAHIAVPKENLTNNIEKIQNNIPGIARLRQIVILTL